MFSSDEIWKEKLCFGLRDFGPFAIPNVLYTKKQNRNILEQWFSTFYGSRHPFSAMEQFAGSPSYNLLDVKFRNLVAPLELFRAPRLRTTVLESLWKALQLRLPLRRKKDPQIPKHNKWGNYSSKFWAGFQRINS